MIGPFNWIDLAFLITIVLLVFNGFRNGAVISLVHLLSIPVAFGVAYVFGQPFTLFLTSNGVNISPLVAYIILFFGAVLILHIIGTVVRGVVKAIPFGSAGDALLGGVLGFIEAWLLWVVVLWIVGNFLHSVQDSITVGNHLIPGFNITIQQYQTWHDTYNTAITNSLFAKVNSFIISKLPDIRINK